MRVVSLQQDAPDFRGILRNCESPTGPGRQVAAQFNKLASHTEGLGLTGNSGKVRDYYRSPFEQRSRVPICADMPDSHKSFILKKCVDEIVIDGCLKTSFTVNSEVLLIR